MSQLVLSQFGTERQMSSRRKQSTWPPAVFSQEHQQTRDRHLHLPQTWKCERGISASRRYKQKAKQAQVQPKELCG